MTDLRDQLAEERERLAVAEEALERAAGDWLMAGAHRLEVTRLRPPEGCTCGTPLYRHPTVLGGYYTAACHRIAGIR